MSVSAECSFIINLDSGVEWVGVPYCKANPKVTVAHSASRAINSTGLTTRELVVVKDMSWARVQAKSDSFLVFPQSGVHLALPGPMQISILTSTVFLPQWGHVVEIAIKSYDSPWLHLFHYNALLLRKLIFIGAMKYEKQFLQKTHSVCSLIMCWIWKWNK